MTGYGCGRGWWTAGLAFAAALAAGGCGSGSSGFDPAARESGAIDSAVEGGGCAPADGLLICGSGAAAPADSGQTFAGATLAIEPASGETAECVSTGEGDECRFEVRIRPAGFPQGTSFLGAYGLDEESAAWYAGEGPFVFLPTDLTALWARFRLGGSTGLPAAQGTRVRVAVLVYLAETLLEPRPMEESEDLLAAFEADLAYVVTGLMVARAEP